MQDRGHLERMMGRAFGCVTGEFAEWTFILVDVQQKIAFNRDFGERWNLDRARDARDNLQRLAEKASGDLVFVGLDRPLPKSGAERDERMATDDDDDRQFGQPEIACLARVIPEMSAAVKARPE